MTDQEITSLEAMARQWEIKAAEALYDMGKCDSDSQMEYHRGVSNGLSGAALILRNRLSLLRSTQELPAVCITLIAIGDTIETEARRARLISIHMDEGCAQFAVELKRPNSLGYFSHFVQCGHSISDTGCVVGAISPSQVEIRCPQEARIEIVTPDPMPEEPKLVDALATPVKT